MKQKIIKIFIIIILSISCIVFTYNNDFIYSKTIMKITKIETLETEVYTNTIGLKENHDIKKITGIISNGKEKGKKKNFQYEETYSSVITDKYKVGDKVFINSYEIEGLKRDTYLVILIDIFLILILLVGKFRGFLAVSSVIFNSLLFVLGLSLYQKEINLTLICIVESIFFTILSLFIANGINKKTMSAVLSVFISLSVLVLFLLILVKSTNYLGINFNEMSFLTVPYTDVIFPELFIGALGAIMDVAITISSSIGELIDKNPKIKTKALYKSGKEIGRDIMSTMINVLFFTYLCSGLPIFVLFMRNGFSIYNYISTNFSLELTRFLVGGIGIVMTIPITNYIAIKILKGRENYE